MSKIISGEEFNELVLNSNDYVFVDFYADWCGPCRMLGPIMDDISNSNNVYKINVDNDQDIAREYGVMSIPCVILYKDGKEVNRTVGLKTKEEILSMVK